MYIVIMKDKTSFITPWYEYDNHWNDDVFCIIKSAVLGKYITFDGKNWVDIEYDHL